MNQDLPIDLEAFNQLPTSGHDSAAAGELLVELRTRVTTRPLHARAGEEEHAVESVGSIIPRVRKILREYPDGRRFEQIALSILDYLLRPNVNRWRHWAAKGRFDSDDQRRTFRRELGAMQPAMHRACDLLEKIRGRVPTLEPDDLFMGIGMESGGCAPVRSRRALQPIEAGIEGGFKMCERVLDAEKEEILDRRASGEKKLMNACGLALSGGGIRSATFALGVLQVLSKRGLFPQIDYLSTVSGGGYLGTFLSSFLNDRNRRIEEVFEPDTPTDTGPVRHLRNNSKFLLEGGARSQFRGVCLMVFGIITNLIALLPLIAFLVLGTWALKHPWISYWGGSLWSLPDADSRWLDTGSIAFLLFYIFGIAALVAQLVARPTIAFATRRAHPDGFLGHVRRRSEAVANWITGIALLFGVAAIVPLLFLGFESLRAVKLPALKFDWLVMVVTGLVPVISGPLATKFGDRKFIGPLLRFVFVLSGPIFFLLLFLLVGDWVFNFGGRPVWILLGSVVAIVFHLLVMDLNGLSPHGIYRKKLASCYLVAGAARGGKVEIEPRAALNLSELGKGTAPYHLINAALNLPGSRNKELRGRKGDFFLFSKHFCGSPITDYTPTRDLEKWDPVFDVGSAMAVSGAAFSSNMAVKNLDHLRFFLALLNIRLGYWLPNILHLGPIMTAATRLKHYCTPGPFYLLREMTGRMDESLSFFNVSDGGHIENLGVYELLRRRCKYVISVDGECDTTLFFDGLIKLIRYARIDLGTEIVIDPAELAKNDKGFSPNHNLMGKIIYPDGSIGWLLYVKLSLTGDESPDVLDYQREQPAFPHQSTLDQIYSEKQFESYRALGQHVAEELFRPEILQSRGALFAAMSEDGKTELSKWFEALAMNLLPDNDSVFRADPTNLVTMNVGISISKSAEASAEEINEATVKVCKRLIGLGAAVVLGHDWREKGVMDAIAKFALEDRMLHEREKPALINRVQIGNPTLPSKDSRENFQKVFDWRELAGSLHKVRVKIAAECNARICLGGKTRRRDDDHPDGFTGPVPGVMEEAFLAARAGQPVLISGCLGGVSKWMADSLHGGRDAGLAPDYDGTHEELAEWPGSADLLVEELRRLILEVCGGKEPLIDLHRRLWITTTLDAAIGIMVEILDVHVNPPRDEEEDLLDRMGDEESGRFTGD